MSVRAMTGGTWAHSTIQTNLIRALGDAWDGKPCRVQGGELKIRTASSIRYPDAMILGAKNAEHQTLAALRRHIALHRNQAAAEVFMRGEEASGPTRFCKAPLCSIGPRSRSRVRCQTSIRT